MSPRFILGREDVPCVAEVVNRSLKADCTDFTLRLLITDTISKALAKLANIAWQTLLFVSDSLAMDKKVTPDLRRKQ